MNLSMKAQVWNQAGKSIEVADAIPGNDPKGPLNVKLAASFGQDQAAAVIKPDDTELERLVESWWQQKAVIRIPPVLRCRAKRPRQDV